MDGIGTDAGRQLPAGVHRLKLQWGGPSKHSRQTRKARDWRGKRKTRQQMTKASRRINRK